MIFYDGMYWSWGPYDLPPDGDFDISDILGSAQSALQMMNFGDIKTFDSGINSSICGNKGSSIVVAMYTWNGGNSFTQVLVGASAGTADDQVQAAGQDVAEFEQKMKSIGWL